MEIVFQIKSADVQSCNIDGMYSVSYGNGSWVCLPCTVCAPGQIISEPCRYNSDTVCKQCPTDTFSSGDATECEPCTVCQPGYYVHRQCSDTGDRLCQKCSSGFYSDVNNSVRCNRCNICRHKETVLRQCDGRNNTLCGQCDNGMF